jgi:hypothetical protein
MSEMKDYKAKLKRMRKEIALLFEKVSSLREEVKTLSEQKVDEASPKESPKDNCETGGRSIADRLLLKKWAATAGNGWWKLDLVVRGGAGLQRAVAYVLDDRVSVWLYTDLANRETTPYLVEEIRDWTVQRRYKASSKEGERMITKTFCGSMHNKKERWYPRVVNDVNFVHPRLILRQSMDDKEAVQDIVVLGLFNDGTRYWSKMNFETLMLNYYPNGSFRREVKEQMNKLDEKYMPTLSSSDKKKLEWCTFPPLRSREERGKVICPSCGSEDLMDEIVIRDHKYNDKKYYYAFVIQRCNLCGEAGDFKGTNPPLINKIIEGIEKEV